MCEAENQSVSLWRAPAPFGAIKLPSEVKPERTLSRKKTGKKKSFRRIFDGAMNSLNLFIAAVTLTQRKKFCYFFATCFSCSGALTHLEQTRPSPFHQPRRK